MAKAADIRFTGSIWPRADGLLIVDVPADSTRWRGRSRPSVGSRSRALYRRWSTASTPSGQAKKSNVAGWNLPNILKHGGICGSGLLHDDGRQASAFRRLPRSGGTPARPCLERLRPNRGKLAQCGRSPAVNLSRGDRVFTNPADAGHAGTTRSCRCWSSGDLSRGGSHRLIDPADRRRSRSRPPQTALIEERGMRPGSTPPTLRPFASCARPSPGGVAGLPDRCALLAAAQQP